MQFKKIIDEVWGSQDRMQNVTKDSTYIINV